MSRPNRERGLHAPFKLNRDYVDVELFAGGGGLALGLAKAGFSPDYLFEFDETCCQTLAANSRGVSPLISGRIFQEDLSTYSWSQFSDSVRLLSGGPPCQAFSEGGLKRGPKDHRNMFPAAIRAVQALRPCYVILENVPGILHERSQPYFEYVLLQLLFPGAKIRGQETWLEHATRLNKYRLSRREKSEYTVSWITLNAADFGLAQARKRVFIIAARRDVAAVTGAPIRSHSEQRLQVEQASGLYWETRGLRRRIRETWPRRGKGASDPGLTRLPWSTVRDVLSSLGPPTTKGADLLHRPIPGGRAYPGHSGSELDWPSKTLKAGVHGAGGGENIVLTTRNSVRHFSLRELARLQGFPDEYVFRGGKCKVMHQIGNAVPLPLGAGVGSVIPGAIPALVSAVRQTRDVG